MITKSFSTSSKMSSVSSRLLFTESSNSSIRGCSRVLKRSRISFTLYKVVGTTPGSSYKISLMVARTIANFILKANSSPFNCPSKPPIKLSNHDLSSSSFSMACSSAINSCSYSRSLVRRSTSSSHRSSSLRAVTRLMVSSSSNSFRKELKSLPNFVTVDPTAARAEPAPSEISSNASPASSAASPAL